MSTPFHKLTRRTQLTRLAKCLAGRAPKSAEPYAWTQQLPTARAVLALVNGGKVS